MITRCKEERVTCENRMTVRGKRRAKAAMLEEMQTERRYPYRFGGFLLSGFNISRNSRVRTRRHVTNAREWKQRGATRAGNVGFSTAARKKGNAEKGRMGAREQHAGEEEKKEIKRQTVSKVPTRNTGARRVNAVARIVELSIKENDPNCIERLSAHYEILKAIPTELPASSK